MELLHVAFIGTYAPTQCGLATFTSALRRAMSPGLSLPESPVIRVLEAPVPIEASRPNEVTYDWHHGDQTAIEQVLAVLADRDLCVIQHEYGIFDGPDGDEIIEVIERSAVPTIVVLHTVLARPTPTQRAVLEAVIAAASVVVTQSFAARRALLKSFSVDAAKIHVIPHGAAPNISATDLNGPSQPRLGAPTILTWGLIGPGKGLEVAIEAFARLDDLAVAPRYIIAGQTHPKVLAHEGERYRDSLKALADKLNVSDRVVFDSRYRTITELNTLICASDIVLLPYESREQVTSGVLVEALASGKPVVATAFPHAREVLASGAGIVVPHDAPEAMASALRSLLTDPNHSAVTSAHAERIGRGLFWPEIGRRYLALAHLTIATEAESSQPLLMNAGA